MCTAGGTPLSRLSQREGPSLPEVPTQLSELSGLKPRPGWSWRPTRLSLPWAISSCNITNKCQSWALGVHAFTTGPQNIRLQSHPPSLQQWPRQSRSGDIKTSQWVGRAPWLKKSPQCGLDLFLSTEWTITLFSNFLCWQISSFIKNPVSLQHPSGPAPRGDTPSRIKHFLLLRKALQFRRDHPGAGRTHEQQISD